MAFLKGAELRLRPLFARDSGGEAVVGLSEEDGRKRALRFPHNTYFCVNVFTKVAQSGYIQIKRSQLSHHKTQEET